MKVATMVGIFFSVHGALLVDAVPAADAEPYGRAVQHGGHYDYWAALRPATEIQRRFKRLDYDAHPRGRVVQFPDRGVYRVYLDRCLTAADRTAIISAFGLQDRAVEFDTSDPHYVCATCSHRLE